MYIVNCNTYIKSGRLIIIDLLLSVLIIRIKHHFNYYYTWTQGGVVKLRFVFYLQVTDKDKTELTR